MTLNFRFFFWTLFISHWSCLLTIFQSPEMFHVEIATRTQHNPNQIQKIPNIRPDWTPKSGSCTTQVLTRDEHGSGLDALFLKIGGSKMDRTQKIFVVLMWLFRKYQKFCLWSDFTGLLNSCVYFAIKCKNATGTILQFELYPPLFTYNVRV